MNYLIGVASLSAFITLSILAAFLLNRRKEDQFGEDAAKWLNDNAQRQMDASYEFSGRGGAVGRAATDSRRLVDDSQGIRPNPSLPDSFNRKEVAHENGQLTTTRAIQPKVGREAKREDGTQPFPEGRWTTRRN